MEEEEGGREDEGRTWEAVVDEAAGRLGVRKGKGETE